MSLKEGKWKRSPDHAKEEWELGEREEQKRRREENMRNQEVWGRMKESKICGSIIDGAIIYLKRNLELGKCREIYKDDIIYQSKQ